MKKLFGIFCLLILSTNINAYDIGDKIDSDVAKKLQFGDGITIVDFFASWCVSCKKELPLISKLSNQLDEKEVKFVGVDTDEDLSEGLEFQKGLNLKFFVFNDVKQEIVAKFNPIGMPAIYYIKDNKVVKKIFGAVDNIDNLITKDIKEIK